MLIEPGTILLFTSGAYSDFGVDGVYIVKEEFSAASDREVPQEQFKKLQSEGKILELKTIEIWVDR